MVLVTLLDVGTTEKVTVKFFLLSFFSGNRRASERLSGSPAAADELVRYAEAVLLDLEVEGFF